MHTMNASSRHLDSQSAGSKTHPLKKFKAANIEILEEQNNKYNLPTYFTANQTAKCFNGFMQASP